jgi:hypothetical protein
MMRHRLAREIPCFFATCISEIPGLEDFFPQDFTTPRRATTRAISQICCALSPGRAAINREKNRGIIMLLLTCLSAKLAPAASYRQSKPLWRSSEQGINSSKRKPRIAHEDAFLSVSAT